jgi:glycerate-2-kinase
VISTGPIATLLAGPIPAPLPALAIVRELHRLLDLAADLGYNDSYTFFTQLGDDLITDPVQMNVNDLVFPFAL